MSSRRSEASSGTELKTTERISDTITGDAFREWYREHVWAQNIREGKAFFNGPSDPKPARRHSPSQLLECSRKTYYRQLNAPEENEDPDGIYWFGSELEDDLILPFLEDVAGENEYVTNSIWVSFTTQTEVGEIEFRGATDPVIVDREANPLILTEVKSKRSLDNLQSPDERHEAQAHVYMQGLTGEYERDIDEAVIIYISRTTLDLATFHIEFDPDFWTNTVLEWAKNHTSYRIDGDLPPANPRQSWECEYCSFGERCGEGSRELADIGADGLLPLFRYPRQKLLEYLQANGGKLTPTLEHYYPKLARQYGVYDWHCRGCGDSFSSQMVEWDGDVSSPPECSECAMEGRVRFLKGPMPRDQGGEL